MIIFIPIKHLSQRIPNKNFRLFREKPLWEHTVDKFNSSCYDVFVNTDSEEIINKCGDKNVTVVRRENSLLGHEVSVVDLIKSFVLNFNITEPICQVHVTSPFLKTSHVSLAFEKLRGGFYDSVFTANRVQARLWREESFGLCPVNHNPCKLEQTQDLPIYWEENSYLYAFNPDVLSYNNRIGLNPYIMEVGYPFNIDIDTEEDWKIVSNL